MKTRDIKHIAISAAPLVYLLIAWSINYYMGFISFSLPRDSQPARYAGAAIIIPLITAGAWWGCRLCLLNGSANLSEVMGHRRRKTASKLSRILSKHLDHALRLAMPYIIILAACVGATYLYVEGLFAAVQSEKKQIFLMIQVFPLWISILTLTYSTFIVFFMMSKHIRHNLRVRLFEIERLHPLGNLVVVNFLFTSALLSLYSINTLVVNSPTTDLIIIVGFLGVILISLLYPMFLIRSVLADRKYLTLERINSSLNIQLSHSPEQDEGRNFADDNDRLQHISDLLTVRKEITDAPLWPVTIPFTMRLLGLIFLPIISWIGAGLVSQFFRG